MSRKYLDSPVLVADYLEMKYDHRQRLPTKEFSANPPVI